MAGERIRVGRVEWTATAHRSTIHAKWCRVTMWCRGSTGPGPRAQGLPAPWAAGFGAARYGRSAEAEHREIPRETLTAEVTRRSLKSFLPRMPDAATTLTATLPLSLPIQAPVRKQRGPRLRGDDPVAILNRRPVSRSAAMNAEVIQEFLRREPFELSSRRMP